MKVKKLIEILQTVKPDAEVHFEKFLHEDKKYNIEYITRKESVYHLGYDNSNSLTIFLVERDKSKNEKNR